MRKILYLLGFIFFSFVVSPIFAEFNPGGGGGVAATSASVNFGSQNSAFKFSPGSTFNISSPNLTFAVDGTLNKNSNANFTGNAVQFIGGVLISDDCHSEMTAVFDPTGSDIIWLTGNSYFDSEPGRVIQKMYIDGIGNRLEGQPIFNDTIDFYDSSTSLLVALQNKLTQNINLNGGSLGLDNDLRLADGVKLIGPGTVKLQDCQLSLGSYYPTPWSEVLIWESSTDIVMTGSVSLTNDWYFTGTCKLNGNGNILDLTGGGRLYLNKYSSLHLADVYIKGLGSGGKIVFKDGNGLLNTSNTDIELDGDVTTSLGKILVEGPTNFVLGGYDWTFNGDSLLQVDGTTLWLDVPEVDPGELKAPLAVFENHVWNPTNVATDLISNLDLINTGTIREVVDRLQSGGGPTTMLLTSSRLTVSLDLDQSVHIHPLQRINICNRITIDGRGATLIFSDPEHSQFVVRPSQTVTLKNIQLDRINQKTFDLMVNSYANPNNEYWDIQEGKIFIGENVVFGLSENVTFSRGLITLLKDSQTGDPVVFRVVGVDGKHKLVFNPTAEYRAFIEKYTGVRKNVGGRPTDSSRSKIIHTDRVNIGEGVLKYEPVLCKLGENTMRLEAINLSGIEHISQVLGVIYAGAIGLGGGAVVDVGDTDNFRDEQEAYLFNQVERYSTVFIVADLDNRLRLLKDELRFKGQLSFAGTGDNVLHIDAVLSDQVTRNLAGQRITAVVPKVYFASNFLDLTSRDPFDAKKSGIARLIFDDQIIRVYNSPNAFWAHENSFLGGTRIEIEGDSIYDDYDPSSDSKPFIVDVQDLVGIGGVDPWVSLFTRSRALDEFRDCPVEFRSFNRKYKTALDLEIEKERERELISQRIQPRIRPNIISPVVAETTVETPIVLPSRPKLRPSRSDLVELLGQENIDDIENLDIKDLKNIKGLENITDIQIIKSILTRTIQPPTAGEKVDYHYNLRSLEMKDANGNHIVDNSRLTKFGISSSLGLNLTLNPSGVIELRSDEAVTLKSDDIINVSHKGNEIHVFNTFNINGNLLFDTDSQLTIYLETDDAKVVFAANSRIDIEANTEFTIEGNGSVEFGDGSIINLKGQRSTVSQWPSLILKDRARISPTSRGAARIQGVGNLIIKDSAKMSATGATGLVLVDTAWVIGNENTDMIDVYVLGTGMIELSGTGANRGMISMQKGDHSLTVYQNGILRIEEDGLLEVNSIYGHGTKAPGNFKKIIFGSAADLYLFAGGVISLSDNRSELPEYGGHKIYWDSRMCNFTGGGLIKYVGYNSSKTFAGIIQTGNAQFKSATTAGTPTIDIVRTLTNQNSSLTTAIEYTDYAGVKQLRLTNATTKAVATIAVTSGDSLNSEDSVGNVSGYTSQGRRVTYNTNGTRVVS
ncbi:hypothetical protein ACFLYH_03025 [Candidatus Dependentiae bacterium]